MIGSLLAASASWPQAIVQFHFDELEYENLHLGHTSLQIESTAVDKATVRFESRELTVAEQVMTSITVTCEASWQADEIQCSDGRLSLIHDRLGQLSGQVKFHYHLQHGLQQVAVGQVAVAGGDAAVLLQKAMDGWQGELVLHEVDIGAVQSLLKAWSDAPTLVELEPLQGRLSADVTLSGIGASPVLRADWALSGLNYSGESVLQDITLNGELAAEQYGDGWKAALDMQVAEGEMYLVPPLADTDTPPGIYIAVPDTGLTLSGRVDASAGLQRIGIDTLHYKHPGVLELEAAALLEPFAENPVAALSVQVPVGDMAAAFPVYLQPWLLDTIYNDLEVTGRAGLTLKITAGRLAAMAVLLDKVTVLDNAGRFAVHEITTDFTVDHERAGHSSMHWQGIDLYRLQFGPGAIGIDSDGLDLRVTEWQDVPIFDGLLRLEQLDVTGLGESDFSVNIAGELVPVSLLTLTEVLEWPPFGGTLGGEFTGLTFSNDDLLMTGELRVRMFDGEVVIRGLRVRDLLGRLPILEAGITVTDIDLERLTETFAFGRITGRLGGHIHDLRLENWQPVMFDAELSTVADRRTRHRISQQALNNISQIGGGLQGALSRGFLRYFDEYSYGDLGISCRLARGYCELGGVKNTDDGHYILTRGGLLPPWVEVRLSGTIVPWDTLIEGFRTIAEGDMVIE